MNIFARTREIFAGTPLPADEAPAVTAPKVRRAERYLPPAAIEKLRLFEEQLQDAMAATRAAADAFNDAQTTFNSLEIQLQRFDKNYEDQGHSRRHMAEARAELEQKVLDAKPNRDRARRVYDERLRINSALGALVGPLVKYCEHLPSPVKLARPVAARPGDPQKAVETIRNRLAAIREERERLRLAPYPASEAKALATAEIEALAARGRPDVGDLLHTKRPIAWPEASVIAGSGLVIDATAIIAHMFKTEMIKAAHAAIDEAADDKLALTEEQRHARRAELDAEKLRLEREEEATISAANRFDLLRRPNADPRAVLGLEDAAPAPKEFSA